MGKETGRFKLNKNTMLKILAGLLVFIIVLLIAINNVDERVENV